MDDDQGYAFFYRSSIQVSLEQYIGIIQQLVPIRYLSECKMNSNHRIDVHKAFQKNKYQRYPKTCDYSVYIYLYTPSFHITRIRWQVVHQALLTKTKTHAARMIVAFYGVYTILCAQILYAHMVYTPTSFSACIKMQHGSAFPILSDGEDVPGFLRLNVQPPRMVVMSPHSKMLIHFSADDRPCVLLWLSNLVPDGTMGHIKSRE